MNNHTTDTYSNQFCYRFQTVNFSNGCFDDLIDMTYVLIMESSKRESNMYKELTLFKPSKTVKVQYNKGYKKCTKYLYDHQTNWDLLDATYRVMIDAKKNKFKNILILEEDFIVNENELTEKNIQNIIQYIQSNIIDVYLLGNFLPSINTRFNPHLKCSHSKLPCGGTQGYIVTDIGIDKFIYLYESKIYELIKKKSNHGHIDWLFNDRYFNTYYFFKPLILQPMEETENLSTSICHLKICKSSFIQKLIYKFRIFYIHLFDLNSEEKSKLINSYNNVYLLSKLIVPVFILIIFI